MRWIAVFLLVALAAFLVIDEGKHEAATVAFGAVALAALLVMIDPATLAKERGLAELSIGPFAAKFVEDARIAAGQIALEGSEREGGAPSGGPQILPLRLQLERKLTYLATRQLSLDGGATYLTIGSLHYDGALTDAQARTASGILTLRDEEIAQLTQADHTSVLSDAAKLVENLRATVHFNLTRTALQRGDGAVSEVNIGGGVRPYFQFENAGGERLRVASVFALNPGSRNLEKATQRLNEGAAGPPAADRRVMVVPDNSRVPLQPDGDLAIVKLQDLKNHLGVNNGAGRGGGPHDD